MKDLENLMAALTFQDKTLVDFYQWVYPLQDMPCPSSLDFWGEEFKSQFEGWVGEYDEPTGDLLDIEQESELRDPMAWLHQEAGIDPFTPVGVEMAKGLYLLSQVIPQFLPDDSDDYYAKTEATQNLILEGLAKMRLPDGEFLTACLDNLH